MHFRHSGATRRIYPLLNTAAYAAIEDARYSEALPLLDEALPGARAADDASGIAIIRGNEAVAHLMLTNDQKRPMPFQSNSGSTATCLSTARWRRPSCAPRR